MFQTTTVRPAAGFFRRNRQRLIEAVKKELNPPANSFIFLKGKEEKYIYDDGKRSQLALKGIPRATKRFEIEP